MIVDISSKLDVPKLKCTIEAYWNSSSNCTTGNHYLVMNRDTKADLLKSFGCTTCRDNEIPMFQNFYIATCETLKYGQVDFK